MSDFILIRNKVTDTGTYYAIKAKAQADYGTAYAIYSEKGFNHFQDLTTFGNALRLGPVTTAVRDMIIPQDGMLIWNIDEAAMEYYASGAWRNFDATFVVNAGTGISITGDGSTLTPYLVSLDLTYVDNRYVNVSGDTMTGFLTLNADPTSNLHAATKQYVDSLAQGLRPKQSVKAATTGAITIASAPSSLDTITLTSGDRILVKNQTLSKENGIYIFNGTGNALTRALDMDTWAEVPSAYLFIEEGATLADTFWVCTSDQGGTIDTTAIVWVQFSTAGTYTASNGITLASNDFSLGGALIQNTTITTAGWSFTVKRSAGDEELFSISNNLIYLYVESALGFSDLTFNGSEILGISKSNNDRVLLSLVTGASSTNSIGSIEATDFSTYYSKFETKSTSISLKTKTSSGGVYKGISIDMSGNATFDTIANATIDTDKFLVSDSGVLKYRTGAEVLSDIGGAPASGSGNYIQNQNASAQTANFWISGSGRLNGSLGVGIAPITPLHVEGVIRASTGAGKYTTIGWDGTNVEIFSLTDAGTSTIKLQQASSISTTLSSSGNITLANTGFKVIGTGAVEWVSLGTYGGWVFNETGADSDFRIEGDTDANLFFLDASVDRVAIGTASPVATYKFTVNGGMATIGGTADFNALQGNYDFLIRSQVNPFLFFADASADAIGVGTTNPVAKIHVIAGSYTGLYVEANTGFPGVQISQPDKAYILFVKAGSTANSFGLINSSGDIAINQSVGWSGQTTHIFYGNGDLGILNAGAFGTTTVTASAILAATSTTRGFLPPRMTAAQKAAISSPAIGLLVYQTDSVEGLYEYTSSGWRLIYNTSTITGSGTTNYISKWTSSSTLGNSLLFDNGTTVGIATSTPNAAFGLHINASTYSTPGANIGLYVSNSGSNPGLRIDNGTQSFIHFVRPSTVNRAFGLFNNNGDIAIQQNEFWSGINYHIFYGNGDAYHYGNLGLGTTPTSIRLEVLGTSKFTSTSASAFLVELGTTGVFKVTGNAGGSRFIINETTNITWAYSLLSGNFATIDDTWTRFTGSYIQFNSDAYIKVNSNSLIIKKDSPTLSISSNLILDDDGSVPHANYKPFIVNVNSVEKFSITKDGYLLTQAPNYSSGGFDYVVRNQTTGRLELNTLSAPAHNLLSSSVHSDTVTASPVLGDIIISNSTPAWSKLAGNTTTTKKFLSQTGNGTISAAPSWVSILASDITSGAALTKTDDTNVTLTLGGSPASSLLVAASITVGWSGQLSLARGGTGSNLVDPNADRILFWDDSASATTWLEVVSPLIISGTQLQFDTSVALNNNARIAVNKNSGATVGTRRRINFIEGTNITLTIADDAGNEEVDITIAASGGISTHNLLDSTVHPDTTTGTVARGDLITGQTATPKWARLAKGTVNQILQSDGTDLSWVSISGDITLSVGVATIANNAVTDAKLRTSAALSIIGRASNTVGNVADITSSANDQFLVRRAGALTWGTLTTTDIPSAALTKTDDTNVTLTLGGSPSTALLAATSLTLGWSGQLSLARGGTGANLVDPNGDKILFWDDSAGTVTWLDLGTNLSISGTTLNASAGAGGYATIQEEGTGLTARTTLNFVGGGFTAADDAGNSRTNVTLDATLNALAAYNTNGILTQTAADTFTGRTITGTASRITITNGDGVAGNPTIDISSSYVGQTTITTLGTIATGVWHGSVIAEIYGGTNQSTYTLGDILYSSASNTLSKLAGNTLTSKRFLSQTGNGTISAAPVWSSITAADIASGAALTKTDDTNVTLTLGGTPATALLVAASLTLGWTGTLSIGRGGTGASTKTTAFNALTPNTTLGDISYHNGTDEVRLGGNITTGKQFLSQTGNGSISAAPVWATITGADITGAALTKTDDTNVTLTLGGTPSTALLRAASLTLGWTGQLSLARGGTGANLTDPNADRILFWDDSAGTMTWLDLGTNLSISGTTLNASAGAGGYATIQEEGFGLTARTTLNFAGGGFTAADDAANNRTNVTLDTTLNVLAAYNTNGILTQTAADTFTGRTITGTTNRITVTNGDGVSGNPTLDISSSYPGQVSITVLGTVTTGIWNASVISEAYGGTNQSTYTLGDILYSSAANTLSKLAGNTTSTKKFLVQTGTGVVSAAPSWGTISGSDVSGAALTKTDDTNVTLTLGGTPASALLVATSITVGWSGQLSLARGGTGANLTDPNVDRILFWDDSAGATTWLEVVSPLVISGTQLQFDTSVALNNNARIAVNKNSGATVGARRRINFIEGTNITLTIADDSGNEEIDVTIAASGGVSTHNLLDSSVHTDTTTGTVARGDLITGQTATPKWTRLAKGTANQFLQSDGTDLAWITLSGDATLSAGVLTIANNAITNVKVNDVAWSKITGRPTTLSGYGITDALSNSTTSTQDGYFGDIYLRDDTTPSHYLQITVAENLTAARSLSIITGDTSRTLTFTGNATISGTNTGDQTITLTGDVTGSGTGSFAATIANDAVTNAKLANVATATFKGRVTAGTGDPEDLTGTQATTLLDVFTTSLKGLAPASGGGTTNFLRADGTWAAPTASSVLLNSIAAATGTNTINNGAHAQEWQWNTLAGATAFKLSSTSTAAASNAQKLFEVLLSGANSTSTQSTYAAYFSNTHTGTSSTNFGLYATASGGSKNWAAFFAGPVMFQGALNTKVGDVTDANYTVSENDSILVLPTPTVSRTLTLPSASAWDGRILIIKNHSTDGTNFWNLSENIYHESNEHQLVDFGISKLEPGTTYILESDGVFWYCISQSINERIRYLYTSDATSNQVIASIPTDTTEAGIIEVYVIGIANQLSNVGKKIAKYYNDGATLTISDITDVLTTTNSIGVAAAWNLKANNPDIEVRVTGKAATNISWRCIVRKTKLFLAV